MADKMLEVIKSFSREMTGQDGEKAFTDTHVFTDSCYIVKAEATVFYMVIDKETGRIVKDTNVQFALAAAHESDEMTFVGFKEDVFK